MKIILISLVLLVICNQILARTLPWHKRNPYGESWWDDYDYDLFNHNNDDFTKFMMGEDSEESKESLKPSANDNDDDGLIDFFDILLGSLLPISEESTDSNKIISANVDDMGKNGLDNDDKSDNDEKIIQFEIHLSNIFETKEPNSSEENKNVDVEENKSSEESQISFFKDNKSDENSNESKPNHSDGIEIIDLTKSSEEKKSEIDDDINEKDINDLAQLFVTLNILEDLVKTASASKNNDPIDDELKAKEVDQYLTLFSAVLDKAAEEQTKLIEQNNSDANKDDENNNFTTQKKESDEEDDNTTTPKNDSDENSQDNDNKDDDGEDENNNNNASDSNEDESNLVFLVLNGIDDDNKQSNLNDHKYAVVDSTQEFKPTSAPFLPESLSTPTSDNQNAIHQYVEIRENLDTQQKSLEDNEITLDKDFYTIIASNYDDESMNKFEEFR